MSIANRESQDIIYNYFHGPRHHCLQDVSIQLIDKVNGREKLVERESQWAYRLRSLRPEGLNDSDVFFLSKSGSTETNVVHKIKVYFTFLI